MLSQPLPRRAVLAAAAAAPAAALLPPLAGCGRSRPAAGQLLTKVTYLTSFGTFGRDAYAYVAAAKGFFTGQDLDVSIEPGGGSSPNLTALVGGSAQFAAFDLSGGIIARNQGTTGFTAIAAIHQLPPVALMATDPDITRPVDLEHRTVGIATGTVTELLFPTWVAAAGGDPATVEIIPVAPPELIPALAAGRVDAIEQFIMGQPTVENAVGGPVQVLPYADVLSDLYGVALHTTTDLAGTDPDLCGRFRTALLAGLDYALNHPDEAGAILADRQPETNPEVAAAELELMEQMSRVTNGPLGTIEEVRVERAIALLQSAGAITDWVEPDDVVAFHLVPGTDGR